MSRAERRPPQARGTGGTDGGLAGARAPGAASLPQRRDPEQVVRQDRRADEDLEPLSPLEQAAAQAGPAQEDRDPAFDARPEALPLLERPTPLMGGVLRGLVAAPLGPHSVPTPAAVTAAPVAGVENPGSAA